MTRTGPPWPCLTTKCRQRTIIHHPYAARPLRIPSPANTRGMPGPGEVRPFVLGRAWRGGAEAIGISSLPLSAIAPHREGGGPGRRIFCPLLPESPSWEGRDGTPVSDAHRLRTSLATPIGQELFAAGHRETPAKQETQKKQGDGIQGRRATKVAKDDALIEAQYRNALAIASF